MTQTMPAGVDMRDCRLYRFWVRHPATGRKVLGYVGETIRQPLTRLMEHIDAQPWADTITSWEVDDEVFAGKAQALRAEAAAIKAERPLYNIRENMGNPLRVKPWEAKAQRWARDDAAGKPRWVPPKERPDADPVVRVPAQARRWPTSRRGAPTWQATAGWWCAGWWSTTALWWLWLDRHRTLEQYGPRWHGVVAAVASAVLLVWAVRRKPLTARQWRRRARRWLR